jgi:hypothetical protein
MGVTRKGGRVRIAVGLLAGVLTARLLMPIPSEASLTDEVDRMWQDANPVPREQCLTFIVKAWRTRCIADAHCLTTALRTPLKPIAQAITKKPSAGSRPASARTASCSNTWSVMPLPCWSIC